MRGPCRALLTGPPPTPPALRFLGIGGVDATQVETQPGGAKAQGKGTPGTCARGRSHTATSRTFM